MALNSVWVHAESMNGEVRPSSLELLTKAREMASEVVAFYAGDDDAAALAAKLGAFGATKVLSIDPLDGSFIGIPLAAGLAVHVQPRHTPDPIRRPSTHIV